MQLCDAVVQKWPTDLCDAVVQKWPTNCTRVHHVPFQRVLQVGTRHYLAQEALLLRPGAPFLCTGGAAP